MLVADIATYHQCLIVGGDRTPLVAACQDDTIEACLLLVVLILGEDTLISHEVGIGELISDTELTAFTQGVGRTGTRDEVIGAERGIAGHRAGRVVVVTHLNVVVGSLVLTLLVVAQEDILL